MHFESLANEVLLDLFEYLSVVDLLHAFYDLNHRLNHLLHGHLRTAGLDLRSVSQSKFQLIFRQFLPRIADHVRFLRLSNDDETPQQIDLFLQYGFSLRQFSQLQSLSVCDLCSDPLMNSMILEWPYLSNLTSLTLAGCYLRYDQIDALRLMNAIWSLSQLVSCYLNVTFAENNLPTPTVVCPSMKSLSIWGIEYESATIYALLQQTPSLNDVSLLLKAESDRLPSDDVVFPVIRTLRLVLSDMNEALISRFLKTMPNLSKLTIDMKCVYSEGISDGSQWEAIIRRSLTHLQVFRLAVEISSLPTFYSNESVNRLLDTFRSPFWLEEHRWVVKCLWNRGESPSYLYLYTTPFRFTTVRLTDLFAVNGLDPPLGSSSSYRFVHLVVDLPVEDDFISTLPTLPQLLSMEVSVTHDDDRVIRQLQNLLDRMPRVKSLSVCCSPISPVLLTLVTSATIRQLDLQASAQSINREECRALARSTLGVHCEVLCINLQDRQSLFDLLEHMVHLRALNIVCEDDNVLVQQLPSESDELLIWLKGNLPPTSIVSRDTAFLSYIRIWLP